MNSLEKYMQSEDWHKYMRIKGKRLYAAFLVDSEDFDKQEYLERVAMKRIIGVDVEIPSVINRYMRSIEFLVKFRSQSIDFRTEENWLGEQVLIMYVNGKRATGYGRQVKGHHKTLMKFVGYKNSKYKPAMIEAGLVTEKDITTALGVDINSLEPIAIEQPKERIAQ